MKSAFHSLMFLFFVAVGIVSGQEDRRVDKLVFAYEVEAEEFKSSQTKKEAALYDRYAEAVERLQKEIEASGDFENAVKAREEAALARVERTSGEAVITGIDPLRKTLNDSLSQIERETEVELEGLADRYVVLAKQMQTELTKEGKLDDAIRLKGVIEGLENGKAELQAGNEESAGSKISESGGRRVLSDVFKNVDSIEALFPIGFDLTGGAPEAYEKANRILKEKVEDALVHWNFTVRSVEDSPLYGNNRRLIGAGTKVEVGGVLFQCEPKVHFSDSPLLSEKENGSTADIIGRIAYCRLSPDGGGTLSLEIAHGKPTGENRIRIPSIPSVVVVAAKYGPKSVADLISKVVIEERKPVWASNGSMKGDPAPGWKKSLNVRVKINGTEKRFSRSEGQRLVFADFFR